MSEIDTSSAEFKEAVESAVAETVAGLKEKNRELIELNKKLRKQTEIDPAEFSALEAERDQLKADLAKAQKDTKKAMSDLEAASKRAEDIDAAFTGSIKEAALVEALGKAGVIPALLPAAKALFAGRAEVVDVDGVRKVMAGDKAISDFITEWAASDEGKHFVSAPNHAGSGSQGGRGDTHNAGKLPEVTDKAGRIAAFAKRLEAATE